MKCTRVEKFLPLYIAGDLAGRRRRRAVENHLAACELCRHVAAEYQASRELFRAATLSPDFDGAFYEEIRNSVLDHIRRDHTPAPPRAFFGLFNARLAYAASLALIIFVAALALHSYTRRTSEAGAPPELIVNANRERPETPATMETPRATRPGSSDRQAPHAVREFARVTTTSRERRAAKALLPEPNNNIERARNEAQKALTLPRRTPPHAGRNPHAPTVAAMTQPNAAEMAATGARGGTNTRPEFSRIEIQTSDPNIRIIWLSPDTEAPARPLK